MIFTKKAYEELLNQFGEDQTQYNDRGTPIKKFGGWMRRTDPIRFCVGYNEWVSTELYRKTIKKQFKKNERKGV